MYEHISQGDAVNVDVVVVTSAYHFTRAFWVAAIVLGSYGFSFTMVVAQPFLGDAGAKESH